MRGKVSGQGDKLSTTTPVGESRGLEGNTSSSDDQESGWMGQDAPTNQTNTVLCFIHNSDVGRERLRVMIQSTEWWEKLLKVT